MLVCRSPGRRSRPRRMVLSPRAGLVRRGVALPDEVASRSLMSVRFVVPRPLVAGCQRRRSVRRFPATTAVRGGHFSEDEQSWDSSWPAASPTQEPAVAGDWRPLDSMGIRPIAADWVRRRRRSRRRVCRHFPRGRDVRATAARLYSTTPPSPRGMRHAKNSGDGEVDVDEVLGDLGSRAMSAPWRNSLGSEVKRVPHQRAKPGEEATIFASTSNVSSGPSTNGVRPTRGSPAVVGDGVLAARRRPSRVASANHPVQRTRGRRRSISRCP